MEDNIVVALKIKGFAKPETIAEAFELGAEQAEGTFASLVANGFAEETRVGTRLTAEGKSRAEKILEAERENASSETMHAKYDDFCVQNDLFKALMSDWQMKPGADGPEPNDHQDAEYDAAILARLDEVHAQITPIVSDVALMVPRVSQYNARFELSLQKLKAGEIRYFGAPIIDSYHTVWFELHQDFIELLGTTRAAEAAAGRAL